MMFRKSRATWVKSFDDYARFLYLAITRDAESFKRCDIITDRYFTESLKEGVQENRGSNGLVYPFDDSTPIPTKFESDFLSKSVNKTNLNKYLAGKFLKLHGNAYQILCITYDDTVIFNYENILTENLINICKVEEADPRIIRHAINSAQNGFKEIQIRTIDSDVVVLCFGYVSILKNFDVNKFYVAYGPKEIYFDVFENLDVLGRELWEMLPFFNALTKCDTTSSFYQIGKSKFRKIWMKLNKEDPSITRTLKKLGDEAKHIDDDDINIIGRFIYMCYGLQFSPSYDTFESLRLKQLITTPNISLRSLVPSIAGIMQHVKRSSIQTGYLWQTSQRGVTIPDPTKWGWMHSPIPDYNYVPLWQDCKMIDLQLALRVCCCSKGTCSSCFCQKNETKCLRYCKCDKSNCSNC